MNHEVLKAIIFDQHDIIRSCSILTREYSLESEANYILTGMRRSGKTTMLYKRVRDLIASGIEWNQIIYINFEDERLTDFNLNDFNDIIQTAAELSRKKSYYFLDEIQNIKGWEKFARRLADAQEHVYITGSNSSMLSREMEAVLGGRYLSLNIMPYNFEEYLNACGISHNEADLYSARSLGYIRAAASQYLHDGGFPESIHFQNKRIYIESIYQKILLGDIAARYAVRNTQALRILMKKIAETVTSEISYTRLYSLLKETGVQISKDSVISYISYAENAYLIFRTQNYIAKFAEQESTPRYYFFDNGLLNLFLLQKSPLLLENIVAINLKRKFKENIFFFKSQKTGIDIDFYLPECRTAIQVTYTLNELNSEREISSLVKLSEDPNLRPDKYMIVTYEDDAKTITCGNINIQVLPLYRFLLLWQ